MDANERKRVTQALRRRYQSYVADEPLGQLSLSVAKRLKRLATRLRDLLRKEIASENSVRALPQLASTLFGIEEDIKRVGASELEFSVEKTIINRYLQAALKKRLETQYFGLCGSYGEALLNCYLDCFISFTVLRTEKEIEAKPAFLRSPLTGSRLELDVLFEDFKLAFEFQGERHYTDTPIMRNDRFKRIEVPRHGRILIPVNVSQLSSELLGELIINSVKDSLGLHDYLVSPEFAGLDWSATNREVTSFCKAVQRVHLSQKLFGEALSWLDEVSAKYIVDARGRSPISSGSPAVRLAHPRGDMCVEEMYRRLPVLARARTAANQERRGERRVSMASNVKEEMPNKAMDPTR